VAAAHGSAVSIAVETKDYCDFSRFLWPFGRGYAALPLTGIEIAHLCDKP
jgi:hypothetical protein